MLRMGTKVKFCGQLCEVMGIKALDYGKGPDVYEIVLVHQKRTYLRKLRELRELNNHVIAHIRDERLRNLNLKEATEEDKKVILNSPVIGFVNISEKELQVVE